MVAAYVDGRPIPRSSRAFTSDASVKRGGGDVRCPSAVRSEADRGSPSFMAGRRASPFDSSAVDESVSYRETSRPSSYAARNPRNVMTVPDAENRTSVPSDAVAPRRTDAVCPRASAICEATVRFQISSYNRNWSPDSSRATWAGVRKWSPAGRIASCASWAPLALPV